MASISIKNMSVIRISELTEMTTQLSGDDFLPIVDSGSMTTYRVMVNDLGNHFSSSLFPDHAKSASFASSSLTASHLEEYGTSFANNFIVSSSLIMMDSSSLYISRRKTFFPVTGGVDLRDKNTIYFNKYSTDSALISNDNARIFFTELVPDNGTLVFELGDEGGVTESDPNIEHFYQTGSGFLFCRADTQSIPYQSQSLFFIDGSGRTYGRSIFATMFSSSKTVGTGFYGTASYALNSNYALHGGDGGTFVDGGSYNISCSWASGSISASYAKSASYAVTSSYAITSSYSVTSSYSISSSNALTASYALASPVVSSGGLPAGSIIAYGGVNAPAGWGLCTGSALLKLGEFNNLYLAISSAYSPANSAYGYDCNVSGVYSAGGLYFKLPDLRGQFLRGYSSPSRLIATNQAATIGADLQIGNHTHDIGHIGYSAAATTQQKIQFISKDWYGGLVSDYPVTIGTYGVIYGSGFTNIWPIKIITTSNTIAPTTVVPEIRPINVSVNYIIKLYN